MDNTYISGFVNSRDIRKHLQDINYEFSVPEYAYLIWQCKEISMPERHVAFEDFLATTESCTIYTTDHPEGWDLHEAVCETMALEYQMMEMLQEPETNCFYTGEWRETSLPLRGKQGVGSVGKYNYFTDYDAAYSYAAYSYALKGAAESETANGFIITKHYIDNEVSHHSREITATYNASGKMTEIQCWGPGFWNAHEEEILQERFTDMWFDFPTPYQPGDILCDRYMKVPFVITEMKPWTRKWFPPKKSDTGHLCYMDMKASGYSVDEEQAFVTWDWVEYYYPNLEYYTGDLSEEKRILLAYSLFGQEKIGCDTLSKLVQIITAEHHAKYIHRSLDWMADEDMIRRFGLDQYRDDRGLSL